MQATANLLETYASYVPALIVRSRAIGPIPTSEPTAERYPAAVLFADISGSTVLAERLAQQGSAGAEELSRLLNVYFGQLIDIVMAHGGSVVKFAGDAMLACWPATASSQGLSIVTRQAAQCGLAVQAALDDYEAAPGLRLRLRVGIGAGEIMAARVGGVSGRWEFLIAGYPLIQMALAEHQARPGDVVVAFESWPFLEEHCSGDPLPEGGVRIEAVQDPLPQCPLMPVTLDPGSEALLRSHIPRAILARLEVGQIHWLAELRRVTVLFLNVTGLDYTRSDALDRVQSVMHAIQSTIYRYEGSINKFGEDDKGTILLAAFGLPPRAHEDDAVRAVQAALALQAKLQDLGFGSAIGIASGRVFCGSLGTERRREYTMVGDIVHLASRLMQAAPDGILCDSTTYQSAQVRVPFQTLPRFTLAGRAEPASVFRPHAPSLEARSRPPMAGRAAERAALTTRLQALKEGTSCVVLIEGGAGIGKSRLVADLRQQARAGGLTSLEGAGDATERSTPYHAWRAVFGQLFRLDELPDRGSWQARVLSRLQPEPSFSRLAPLLNAILPLDLPENEISEAMTGQVRADNTHDLLASLLQMEAASAPLLLILENAHWMDSASWTLARHVSKVVQPLLLVCAIRPMDDPLPSGYRQVLDASSTEQLRLETISADDTKRLLCECLGVAELSETVVTLVLDRAEGNPFFSEELAYALRDSGLILVSDGVCQVAPDVGDISSLTLPDSIQGVITSRLDRLMPAQSLTLKAASAVGRVFPFQLLRDIHPIEGAKAHLHEDLAALVRLDIIRAETSEPELTYAFKQIVMQEIAYEQLAFAQRRRLHRAIAEWYERTWAEDLSPFYPLLAYHWSRAEANAKTIDCLEKAGELALRSFANREAVAFLSQAVALDAETDPRTDSHRRAHWELQLGEAHVNRSNYTEGRQHLEAGLALLGHPTSATRPGQVADLLRQVSCQILHRLWPRRYLGRCSDQQSSLLAASRALERLTEVYYFANEMVLSLAAALRTLNLAETAGLSPELARGYAAVGALAGFIPLHRTAEAYLNRALVTARKADHLPARAFVSLAVGFYYAGIGNWATAQEHFEQVVEISERLGDRRRQDDGLSNIMYVSHLQGDFWRGAGAADELHARAIRRDEPRIQAVGLQGKANCLLHLGRFGEAMACLEESQALLAEDNEIVDEPLKIELYGLLAIAHLRQSAYSQALSATKQLLAMTTGSFPSNYGTFPGYSSPPEVILTLWQAHYQEPDLDVLAHRACRTLGGFSRVFPIGQPRAQLWQGLYNWLTGHQARAIKAWQESLAAAERMSMLYDQGLAHYEIGRHLERDEPARQMHLARACQLFSEQDAQYNLHLARDETKHSAHE